MTATQTAPSRLISLKQVLLIALLVIFGLPSLLGFFGSVNWLFDLVSHFREYYLIAFFLITCISIFLKQRILSVIAIIFLVMNMLQFIPFYYPVEKIDGGTQTTIFSANVQMENRDYQSLLTQINSVRPDVIVLEEVNDTWVRGIQELSARYPYSLIKTDDHYAGIMLLSKHPLTNAHFAYLGSAGKPIVVATIPVGKKQLTVIGIHPHPPFGERSSLERDRQIAELGDIVNAQSTPTVVMGDMNSTPFSYPYLQLLKDTKLQDCFWGFGYPRTWQFNWYKPPLRLSIDHCFLTPGVLVHDATVGLSIGSDHLPIIVKVAVN